MLHIHSVPNSIYLKEWLRLLARIQNREVHEVYLVGTASIDLADLNREKVRVLTLDNGIMSKLAFILKLFRSASKSSRVVLHFLSPNFKMILVYLVIVFLKKKKVTWVLWGGDLYYNFGVVTVPGTDKISWKIRKFLLKFIVRNLDEIACLLKEDYNLAVEVTGTKAKYRHLFYPNPVNLEKVHQFSLHRNSAFESDAYISVLVGNSADPSNNHLEVFEALQRLPEEEKMKLRIICPLAYGNFRYAAEVKNYGERSFGNRFVGIYELQEPEEYAKLLSTVNVAIFNHRRQQALGNILALLAAGKTVFIRSDTTTWKFLKSNNLKVFDTIELLAKPELIFKYLDKEFVKQNSEIVVNKFGYERCLHLWEQAFCDYETDK